MKSIKKLPHTKRVYKKKKKGGSQHYWTGRKPKTIKGLKRKDFSYSSDSRGYMIKYKGINIGGTGSLAMRNRIDEWRIPQRDIAYHRLSAEDNITHILNGTGEERFYRAIRKIDSYQRPKKQFYNGRQTRTQYETDAKIRALIGEDGGYPQGENLVRDEFVFHPKTITAVTAFRRNNPWRGSHDVRYKKFKKLVDTLVRIYEYQPIKFKSENITGGSSGASNWSPMTRTLTLTGKFSVMSLLHEFGHAKGYNEKWATFWSQNLFKRAFPEQWARTEQQAGGHLILPRQSRRTMISGTEFSENYGDTPITISAPHDVRRGSGFKGDLFTGGIARKVAMKLRARVVIMTNFRDSDVHINYPVYRTPDGSIESTMRGKMIFQKYISALQNDTVVEIHGFRGEENNLFIATNKITEAEARKIKAAGRGFKILIEPIDEVEFSARLSRQYGILGMKRSMHIEIPKNHRANPASVITAIVKMVKVIIPGTSTRQRTSKKQYYSKQPVKKERGRYKKILRSFGAIPLKDFDPNKHANSNSYYSNRGIQLQCPSLLADIDFKKGTATSSSTEKVKAYLDKNPDGKAYFMILSGSRGGLTSAWYKLKNIWIDDV